jgi:cyclophilin family peptidyl-prolyl cis-trans isomerase
MLAGLGLRRVSRLLNSGLAGAMALALVASGLAHAWPWQKSPSGKAVVTTTKAKTAVKPSVRRLPAKPPSSVAVAQGEYVLLETQRGNVVIQLFRDEAPKTVANFIRLTDQGFYNQVGMVFHRVVPGFVVQTGDPTGTGEGGSDERIPLEVNNKLSHRAKGMVAMARTYDPNSATSQFYITLTSQRQLDGKYAIFGKVVRGLPVLSAINQGDKVYGVRRINARELPPEDEAHKHPFGLPLKR